VSERACSPISGAPYADASHMHLLACRISFDRDTKVPNAGTFTLQREDHTIGNLVRM
jgi:hypothetical protein